MGILATNSNHIVYIMLGLYGLLLAATFLVRWTPLSKSKSYNELNLRIITWWKILLFFSVMVFFNVNIAIICVGLISYFALREYFTLISAVDKDPIVVYSSYLAIPLQYYIVAIGWYNLFIIFIPVYVFLFLPFLMILQGQTKQFLTRISRIQWGLMIAVFSMGHISYLLKLDPEKNSAGGSSGLVIFIVVLTQLNDVAQYIWGKSFGKNKIVPTISPNKTWAGFVGGCLSTAVISFFLGPYLTPMSSYTSFTVGLLIGAAGFIGDVNISALKRDLGVKDSGNLLPGHGGILDRVDSLSYTAPIFFHFIDYFYY